MSFSSTDSFEIESLVADCEEFVSKSSHDKIDNIKNPEVRPDNDIFVDQGKLPEDLNGCENVNKTKLEEKFAIDSTVTEQNGISGHEVNAHSFNERNDERHNNEQNGEQHTKQNGEQNAKLIESSNGVPNHEIKQNNKKYVKQTSSEEVKSLLSFWSDKTTLHAPLKRAESGGGLKIHWLEAMQKAKHHEDPWIKYNIIETCQTERAKRYRYNALKKKWIIDLVYVKMQDESFGQGAMRKCYRMKKLSTSVHKDDWTYAGNVVSKRYIEDVIPKVYFDDVKLQMDAKLWAEEYNRHRPPKKIDIIQVACISMIDREGLPMYHIEHFVEGKYVKYNSNSGFVLREEEHVRSTPQAFSHFTFERSGHQMMVVDVQGVGDLYTDPQIHTAVGFEYGEANLGTKGMSLFFATHECTDICNDLNLEKFDLSDKELRRIADSASRSSTTTEIKRGSPHSPSKMAPMFELVERLKSVSSEDGSFCEDDPMTSSGLASMISSPGQEVYSGIDSGISTDSDEGHANYFMQHEHKGACVEGDELVKLTADCIENRLKNLKEYEDLQISILGNIHFDLALYNSIGRFTDNIPDNESTLFHLNKATLCGCLEANKIMALKYFNLPTDKFEDLKVEEDPDKGMDCLIEAASRGDKEAIIKTAQAFDFGVNLGKARQKSWTEALKWYEVAVNMQLKADDSSTAHEINARMAEIWREGGYGVEKDPSYAGELYTVAADAAMAIGKGKLANKYFMLAEEAWGEVEE